MKIFHLRITNLLIWALCPENYFKTVLLYILYIFSYRIYKYKTSLFFVTFALFCHCALFMLNSSILVLIETPNDGNVDGWHVDRFPDRVSREFSFRERGRSDTKNSSVEITCAWNMIGHGRSDARTHIGTHYSRSVVSCICPKLTDSHVHRLRSRVYELWNSVWKGSITSLDATYAKLLKK